MTTTTTTVMINRRRKRRQIISSSRSSSLSLPVSSLWLFDNTIQTLMILMMIMVSYETQHYNSNQYMFVSSLHDNNNDVTYQKIWNKKQLIQLLNQPQCAAAIKKAQLRHPYNVPICPLCTRGQFSNTNNTKTNTTTNNTSNVNTNIQYMKIPKAGSSTMINLLTNDPFQQTKSSKTLCQYQDTNDIRFTMIRDPSQRIFSAYGEVDLKSKTWNNSSSHLSYRNFDKDNEPVHRFLQFLYDFYMGYMNAWDGGMPHHMYGAALHFDTLRSNNNDFALPDIIGRLEYIDDFINQLYDIIDQSQYNKTLIQDEWFMEYNNNQMNNGINDDDDIDDDDKKDHNNDDNDDDFVKIQIKSVRVHNHKKGNNDNIYYGIEWLLEELFEEDYICFGYPYHSTLYNETSSSTTTPYHQLPNYILSKSIFTNEVLNHIHNNYNNDGIQPPPTCESHYKGGINNHMKQYVTSKTIVNDNE